MMSEDETLAVPGLFSTLPQTAPRHVTVFVDEVKPTPDVPWAYLVAVSLPTAKLERELGALGHARTRIGYERELKFSAITTKGEKSRLGEAWIERVVDAADAWHFGVVGMDMSALAKGAFGSCRGDQIANVHRRFLRSVLSYHLQYAHLCHTTVVVDSVYHDNEGRLEADPWFSWHAIDKISSTVEGIAFAQQELQFVDSDHNKEKRYPAASHFIQVADLIVGATRYAFDIARPHRRPGASDVVRKLLPVLERINDNARRQNINSSYRHVHRCHLGFFPSKALSLDELEDPCERALSRFYVGRQLKFAQSISGQLALPFGAESC
jgi:hypothetical protein